MGARVAVAQVEALPESRDAREGRRTRLLWACGFFVVAGVYFGAHLLPLPSTAALVLNQLAFLAPIAISSVGGLMAYRRSAGVERRFWLLLTAANTLLLVSEAYYSGYMILVDIGGPPPPSLFEVLNLTAAMLFFGLLMSMTKLGHSTLVVRVRFITDVLGIMIVAVTAVYVVVVVPLFDAHHLASPVMRVLAAVYPVVGLVMLSGTLTNIVGFKVSKWQPWEKLVALALGIFSCGLLLWPLSAVMQSHDTSASIFDLVYLGGWYLLVMATVSRLTTPGASRLRPMPPPLTFAKPIRGPLASLGVPAAMLAGVAYFAAQAYGARHEAIGYAVFSVLAAALGTLLVARTALTAVENGYLFQRSVTDPLTGVYNHRYFHERLAVEIELAGRYGETVSVAVMDLDDFSRVNNLRGHTTGDRLLAEVAQRLVSACRDSDAVCRIGGDEFGLILPEAPPEAASAVCHRALDALRAEWAPLGWPVTASIGLATYPTDAEEKEDLLRKADGAQYWGKYHGKDQVVRFDAEVVEALDAEERIRRLEERSHLATVAALAAAVDARDPLTQDHSRNVARLAVALSAELRLDADKVKLLEVAALLHDIGKIGISDDVLRKRGPLDAEERRHIEEHPELGVRILSSTSLREILPWTRGHHERWDGAGYPQGLAGEAIPLEARILAICDAYDSMTSERPYHSAMPMTEALHEIDLAAGTQFDPYLADTFVAMMKRMPLTG